MSKSNYEINVENIKYNIGCLMGLNQFINEKNNQKRYQIVELRMKYEKQIKILNDKRKKIINN